MKAGLWGKLVVKTCGETFGLVRFVGAGAVCGCGCGSRAGKLLPAHRGLIKTPFCWQNVDHKDTIRYIVLVIRLDTQILE